MGFLPYKPRVLVRALKPRCLYGTFSMMSDTRWTASSITAMDYHCPMHPRPCSPCSRRGIYPVILIQQSIQDTARRHASDLSRREWRRVKLARPANPESRSHALITMGIKPLKPRLDASEHPRSARVCPCPNVSLDYACRPTIPPCR